MMHEWGGVPWCCDETGGGAGMCASAPIPGEKLVRRGCVGAGEQCAIVVVWLPELMLMAGEIVQSMIERDPVNK